MIQAGEQLGFKGLYIATQFGASLFTGLQSAGVADKVSGRLISAAFSLLPDDPASYSAELGRFQKGIKQYAPDYALDPTAVSGWAAGKLFADALAAVGPDSKKILQWVASQKKLHVRRSAGPDGLHDGQQAEPVPDEPPVAQRQGHP